MIDCKSSNTEPRELTRSERAAIKKLVTEMCANYGRAYGCLLLKSECYMLCKWWSGSYCKYFVSAVLPLEAVLEASLLGYGTPKHESCAICNKPFVPDGRQAYCGASCANSARQKRQREYMRKRRRRS